MLALCLPVLGLLAHMFAYHGTYYISRAKAEFEALKGR